MTITWTASSMGQKGGSVTGGVKAETARENGQKGGRPRKYPVCASGQPHRWNDKNRCRFCGKKKNVKNITTLTGTRN